MANEATLQAKIISKFLARGIYCRKLTCVSARGFPDLIAIRGGHTVLIEVKHPDGKGELSPQQLEEIFLLREHGAVVYVVNNLEEALNVAQEEFDRRTERRN